MPSRRALVMRNGRRCFATTPGNRDDETRLSFLWCEAHNANCQESKGQTVCINTRRYRADEPQGRLTAQTGTVESGQNEKAYDLSIHSLTASVYSSVCMAESSFVLDDKVLFAIAIRM
jgi:hypothetical protein